mmetsp:Transcript_5906/g.8645  ORF Transcript_5906/g.8645 Transcript_5906/m.8645 type:complete len:190 (+) Transcript_5906:413-982(+)
MEFPKKMPNLAVSIECKLATTKEEPHIVSNIHYQYTKSRNKIIKRKRKVKIEENKQIQETIQKNVFEKEPFGHAKGFQTYIQHEKKWIKLNNEEMAYIIIMETLLENWKKIIQKKAPHKKREIERTRGKKRFVILKKQMEETKLAPYVQQIIIPIKIKMIEKKEWIATNRRIMEQNQFKQQKGKGMEAD